ncbi:helix-turn-helix domain-containing protein [Yoonia sp. 2307UL14-13]|uniref:helix-turn-helix domain-containing protein n=1 Tax=Yoonia sp. 2307UL14-13 TaxID=3126506 RepID=UPI00309EED84
MSAFPETLKTWRKTRRLSQLDLALEADVSSRHISFLETGRARPSRDMIGRLSDVMQLPLAARNQMLTHAGFAAQYSARDWDGADMAPVRMAIDHMLDRHAPYPALALDRLWILHKMNGPARTLFAGLNVTEGDSLLDLMMSDHLPPLIENWPDVAHHAAQRLRTESVAQGGIAMLDRVAAHLAQVPGRSDTALAPVVPTIYRLGEARLSLFATIAQFGTPEDLALNELKIELYFPADEASRVILENLTG